MYQLVYLSRSLHPMSDEELDEILTVARRNNRMRDITGMLLYSANTFLQVLEGQKNRVEELFDELYTDPRHRGAMVLHRGNVAARAFEDWSMGFERLDESDKEHEYFFELSGQTLDQRIPEGATAKVLKLINGFAASKLSAA